ncbi:MAG TPA: GEVED domain-containing protein [Thermoanaerobaculia bacterium]|nr:GEVED domain-containing protein [Thermoanaerobaculia bacterium]
MRRKPRLLLLLFHAIAAQAAAQEILLEKLTNGQEADSPPGPILLVGAPVTWTYVVSNPGGRDLLNVSVSDDQGVVVTCPSTTVPAGESIVCTGNGTAQAGQYANIGTVDAELINGTPVSASDPSHYFGQEQVAITLEKSTEGQDADLPPGPSLPVGDPVDWTYEVTNVGSDPLSGIAVTDDQGETVTCPGDTLAPGESMTCTASGTVQIGQYANVGSVTADLPDQSVVGASDPSHYFGQILLLEKSTNGQDADLPPGPTIQVGDPVAWTYTVSNPGPAPVTGLAVTDDQGVTVTCPVTTLAASESVICTAAGTAEPGQYANVGTATAQLPLGGTVSASDPSHYFGQTLVLQKSTNGQDADLPPGPVLAPGATVTWTYEVTNAGSDPFTGVTVTDNQGVTVTCPGTTLAPGESMTCTANGTAIAGQYSNLGTATALDPDLNEVITTDLSHYFGQDQVLDFGDAPAGYLTSFAANGARHLLGSAVYLGACVDSELDGQPSAGADGDDLSAGLSTFGACAVSGDDEDGVTFTTPVATGTTAGVTVTASAACTLSAWIDFNRDGDWGEADDDIFPGGIALAAGANALTFPVPPLAAPGATAARFRCTSAGAVSFTGQAADGEVEDYAVTIILASPSLTANKAANLLVDQDNDGFAEAGDTIEYTVTIVNNGTGAAAGVVFTDTPGAGTSLVNGSVTTAPGIVVVGNTPGDTTVEVAAGTLAGGGGSATITFRVMVGLLAPGTQEIVNQGLVSGANFASLSTDDPDAPGAQDPTVVPAAAAPSAVEIPTLSPPWLLLLLLLLTAVGLRRLRLERADGSP